MPSSRRLTLILPTEMGLIFYITLPQWPNHLLNPEPRIQGTVKLHIQMKGYLRNKRKGGMPFPRKASRF